MSAVIAGSEVRSLIGSTCMYTCATRDVQTARRCVAMPPTPGTAASYLNCRDMLLLNKH